MNNKTKIIIIITTVRKDGVLNRKQKLIGLIYNDVMKWKFYQTCYVTNDQVDFNSHGMDDMYLSTVTWEAIYLILHVILFIFFFWLLV